MCTYIKVTHQPGYWRWRLYNVQHGNLSHDALPQHSDGSGLTLAATGRKDWCQGLHQKQHECLSSPDYFCRSTCNRVIDSETFSTIIQNKYFFWLAVTRPANLSNRIPGIQEVKIFLKKREFYTSDENKTERKNKQKILCRPKVSRWSRTVDCLGETEDCCEVSSVV